MSRKQLTLFQCRFLAENLQLNDYEHRLHHAPFLFLNDVARAFRLNVPFNAVHVVSHFHRTGKFQILSPELFKEEVMSGRGGSCLINNPFLRNFLTSLGFKSDLMYVRNASRSMTSDAFHDTVVCRDVETPDDFVVIDVGTWFPAMRAVQVHLKGNNFAHFGSSEEFQDIHTKYTFVSSDTYKNFLIHSTAPKTKSYNIKAIFDDMDDGMGLVRLHAMDSMTCHILPHLSNESKGTWIPFQIFSNLAPFDVELVNQVFIDEDIPLDTKLGRGLARIPLMSGFGIKSRDFIIFLGRNYYRIPGTSHDNVNSDVILATNSDPEVIETQSDDEILSIVSEELPKLTDYFRDALEIRMKFK